MPSSHHPGGCDAWLSSPSDPRAQHGKTSLPVRQLPRQAPPRPDSRPVLPWQQTLLTHSLARSTPWLPRQQTIPLMRFGACFIYVYLPVDYDAYAQAWWRFVIVDIPQPCPLDRLGPPPVGWRPRPSVPLAIEKGARGVCPPRVSRHTPSLKAWMKKNQKNKVMTRILLPLLVRAPRSWSLRPSGWIPTLLLGAATKDPVDPVLSPWTASTELTVTLR